MFKLKPSNNYPDGRKYKLSLTTLLVILLGYVLGSLNPAFAPLFPELISGAIATLVVYAGGNIGNKWITGKTKQEESIEEGK